MEFFMIILCGILVGFGVYMMLSKSTMRIIIGVGLFGHAANLIILIAGGLNDGDIPIISELGNNYIDPVPAALILTAIVIGFAVTCLLISIYIANYKLKNSDDINVLEDVENIKEVSDNA
ncbi:sodium:proton antiporter [Gemelliphila palaticanis]|uniref:NADH-quinone oxidoreductase subunit K n=1 Tax=Gemelliphila palaticanis TaxID=81950 RepID=A0ABX2T0M0_9BACL|nr:NADH-quinone oxidoreductase subunit K [Gemella palaticanis]MBF0715044.1 NADH-quinone oxidoreductase subunit K [Gemella palaticanis]NYS46974.1 NADH-quinone oxidoreductase subunit K [Gemella palaticanis]